MAKFIDRHLHTSQNVRHGLRPQLLTLDEIPDMQRHLVARQAPVGSLITVPDFGLYQKVSPSQWAQLWPGPDPAALSQAAIEGLSHWWQLNEEVGTRFDSHGDWDLIDVGKYIRHLDGGALVDPGVYLQTKLQTDATVSYDYDHLPKTVSFWVRFALDTRGTGAYWYNGCSVLGPPDENGDCRVVWNMRSGGFNRGLTYYFPYVDKWRHIVLRFQTTGRDLWVDGEKVQEDDWILDADYADPVTTFGVVPVETHFYHALSEYALWEGTELSDQDIVALYNDGQRPGYELATQGGWLSAPAVTPEGLTEEARAAVAGWWMLDEADGPRYDSHGSHHLTVQNSVGTVQGPFGLAADFLQVGNNALLTDGVPDFGQTTGNFSVVLWYNTLYENPNNSQHIYPICQGYPAGNSSWNNSWGLYSQQWQSSVSAFNLKDNVSVVKSYDNRDLVPPAGTWAMAAVGFFADQDRLLVSMNGRSFGCTTMSGPLDYVAADFPLQIARGFQGAVANVAYFSDYILTAQDLAALWNDGQGLTYSQAMGA